MNKYSLKLAAILVLFNTFTGMAQHRRSAFAHRSPLTMGSIWVSGFAGLNSNWIMNQNAYGNQEIEYAPTFGATAGLGANFFYNRDWGYGGSICLSKFGQNYKGWQAGAEALRKVKLTYVEVPLVFMRQLSGMIFPTWISVGPDVMILVKANQDYIRDGGSQLPNPDGMISGDVKERFKPVDVALHLAISSMFDFDRSRKQLLLFSINSSIGVTDINTVQWQIKNTHNSYGGGHNFYVGFKAGMMLKASKARRYRWR